MQNLNLIFPNQLFEESTLYTNNANCVLVEHDLYFNQFKFHKQKLAYHRASMQVFKKSLEDKGLSVRYVSAQDKEATTFELLKYLKDQGCQNIQTYIPVDNWLEKQLSDASKDLGITIEYIENPLFFNPQSELDAFFGKKKSRYFHNDFYIQQRKKHKILIDGKEEPVGGKWSFDAENRKKYPRKKVPPTITWADYEHAYQEAFTYVEANYSNNYGKLNKERLFPVNYKGAKIWFENFLSERFEEFGPYEDAIVQDEPVLHHSVLTPMLNSGLITPKYVVGRSIDFALENNIPLNSLEGFIRQIIGWREFIRGFYVYKGVQSRTKNYWGFERKIPKSFYDGTTGIPILDHTIHQLLDTGYNHHIERLMVLGNFMLLCEFDPDEVYQWFMEMYIDAYDWVMVPNVYGMSQFADGGLMATKPYISGSNYLMKMSNFKKGPWQEIWDGLFWRFMHVHRDFFTRNPRLGMLVKMFDKMPEEKKEKHMTNAENFLNILDEKNAVV
jgi:deoxyribodipyrimidine photolyase-related protein